VGVQRREAGLATRHPWHPQDATECFWVKLFRKSKNGVKNVWYVALHLHSQPKKSGRCKNKPTL